MSINPIVLSIPVFFGLILIELSIDLITGKKSYRLGDAYGNISCGIFEQTTGVLLKIFTVGLYTLVYQFHLFDIPHFPIYAILLFLGVDFLYYWAHRMSHEVNLLWLGHVVHHQSEDYNLSVALRQGAAQKIFTAPFYLPLAFIGFDPEWFVYILAWNTLYQFWIHTEKIDKLGPLEWILNTPSHHRVHHGRNPKYIDKNHAATLIIWDKMFGTFQAEEERPTYGITKPVDSFNPIEAHWKPFVDLWKEAKPLTLQERLKLLWTPPGWRPDRLGGREYAPEIEDPVKYEVTLSKTTQRLLLLRFAVVLGFVAAFLFAVPALATTPLLIGVATIILAVYTLGQEASGSGFSIPVKLLSALAIGLAWYSLGQLWIGVASTAILALTSWLTTKQPRERQHAQ